MTVVLNLNLRYTPERPRRECCKETDRMPLWKKSLYQIIYLWTIFSPNKLFPFLKTKNIYVCVIDKKKYMPKALLPEKKEGGIEL